MPSKKAKDPSLVERAEDKWKDRIRKYKKLMGSGSESAYEEEPEAYEKKSSSGQCFRREM